MSVLSNPQGTPERVWSLVAGLAAIGKSAPRDTYKGLLNPGYVKDGDQVIANESLASNAHGAALSLKLVDATRDTAQLLIDPPSDFAAFADHVHDYLAALSSGDADAPILETVAWIHANTDCNRSTNWIYQLSRKEFADHADSAIAGDGEKGQSMNTTKLPAWRRWLTFLGLSVALPFDDRLEFPTPIGRMLRELERGSFAPGTVRSADDFINWVAQRMPYLDRGRLYGQACHRIGHVPTSGRLSPLLSHALRELHDEGAIQLVVSGDAADRVRLFEDSTHAFDAFTEVTIFPRTAA